MKSSICIRQFMLPLIVVAAIFVLVRPSHAGRSTLSPEKRLNIGSPEHRPTGLPTIEPKQPQKSFGSILRVRSTANEENKPQKDQPTQAPPRVSFSQFGILGAQAQAFKVIDDSDDWDPFREGPHPILSSYYDSNPEEDLNSLIKESTEDPLYEELDEELPSLFDDLVDEANIEPQIVPDEVKISRQGQKTPKNQPEVFSDPSNAKESVDAQNKDRVHDSNQAEANDEPESSKSVVVIESTTTTTPSFFMESASEAVTPIANATVITNADGQFREPTTHGATSVKEDNPVNTTESSSIKLEQVESSPSSPKLQRTYSSDVEDKPETVELKNTSSPANHNSETLQAEPSKPLGPMRSVVSKSEDHEMISDPELPSPDSFQHESFGPESPKSESSTPELAKPELPKPEEPERPVTKNVNEASSVLPVSESLETKTPLLKPPKPESSKSESSVSESSEPALPKPKPKPKEPERPVTKNLDDAPSESYETELPTSKLPKLESTEPESPESELSKPEESEPQMTENEEAIPRAILSQDIESQGRLGEPQDYANELETPVSELPQHGESLVEISGKISTQFDKPTLGARAKYRQSRLDRESLKLTSQTPEMISTESPDAEISSATVSTEDTLTKNDVPLADNSEDSKSIDKMMIHEEESKSEPPEIDYSLIGATIICVVFVSLFKIGKLMLQTKSAPKTHSFEGTNSKLKDEVESSKDSLRTVKKDLGLDEQSNLQEYVKRLKTTNSELSRLVDQQNKLSPVKEAIDDLKESFGGDPDTKVVDRRRYLQNLKLSRALKEKHSELQHKVQLSKCQQLMMIKNFVKLDDLLDLMKHIEIDEISRRLREATFELKVQHDLYKEWLGDLRDFGIKFKNDYDELTEEISQERKRDLATEKEISKLWEQCDQLELSDSIDDLKRKVADKAAETDRYYKDYINNYYWLNFSHSKFHLMFKCLQ